MNLYFIFYTKCFFWIKTWFGYTWTAADNVRKCPSKSVNYQEMFSDWRLTRDKNMFIKLQKMFYIFDRHFNTPPVLGSTRKHTISLTCDAAGVLSTLRHCWCQAVWLQRGCDEAQLAALCSSSSVSRKPEFTTEAVYPSGWQLRPMTVCDLGKGHVVGAGPAWEAELRAHQF